MDVRSERLGALFAPRPAEDGVSAGGREPSGGAPGISPVRRGSPRHLRVALLAGGLVVVCALGVNWRVAAAGERVRVLAMARPVMAGQVLSARDLTEVVLPFHSGVAALPAGQEDQVVGRRVGVALWRGAPLATQALANPAPSAGQQVVDVPVKEGHYPAVLALGDSVAVYDAGSGDTGSAPVSSDSATSASATGGAGAGAVSATVLGMREATATPGVELVTLRTSSAGAARLAAAATPVLAVTAPAGSSASSPGAGAGASSSSSQAQGR